MHATGRGAWCVANGQDVALHCMRCGAVRHIPTAPASMAPRFLGPRQAALAAMSQRSGRSHLPSPRARMAWA